MSPWNLTTLSFWRNFSQGNQGRAGSRFSSNHIPWGSPWQGAPVSWGQSLQRACKLQILKTSLRCWALWSLLSWTLFKDLRVYLVLKRSIGTSLLPAVSHPKNLSFQPEQGKLMHSLPVSKSNSIPLPAICLRLPHAYFMISGTFPPYLTSCNASLCCLYYFYLW